MPISLKINALAFYSLVTEGYLDWSFESVDVPLLVSYFSRTRALKNGLVVASSLVSFVFLHERKKLLGGPPLCLEVVIVRCRSTRVHLESLSSIEPNRNSRFVYLPES